MEIKTTQPIIFILWTIAQISETTAELNIGASHIPFGEVQPSEVLHFTVTVAQVEGAKLDATNIKLQIAFPWFISFTGVNNDNGIAISTIDLGHGNIEFSLPDMSASEDMLALKINMGRNLSIDLHSGWHSIVTPMKLQYSTVLIGGGEGKKQLTYSMPFIVPGCATELGMGNRNIEFYQLEASSSLPELRPDKARLGEDAWCAREENTNQWIQITLKHETRITAIATYARKAKESYVKKYKLQYSENGVDWHDYSEDGFAKVFDGNDQTASPQDRDTAKKHWLTNPIVANYIRFRPVEWEIALCMRLEMYGCLKRTQENCIRPLGMENGHIPDASLSHNVQEAHSFPSNIRLNKKVTNYPFGWLAPTGMSEWIQIDLGSTHKIDKVAIQGAYGEQESSFYVTMFKMKYSNTSSGGWQYVKDANGQPAEFRGPTQGYDAVFPQLLRIPGQLNARFIRVIPEEFFGMSVMRIELYGCMVEDKVNDQAGSPVGNFSRRTALLVESTGDLYACMYIQNHQQSSCMRTQDGNKWHMLDANIISVVAYDINSKDIFAINRALSIVKSNDKGETWAAISSEEWVETLQLDGIKKMVNIPDILPGNQPDNGLTFVDDNSNMWGISGAGIHTKTKDSGSWTTAAKWKCCGK